MLLLIHKRAYLSLVPETMIKKKKIKKAKQQQEFDEHIFF